MTYNYSIIHHEHTYNKIHPLLEIWRVAIITKFIDRFYEKCLLQDNKFNKSKMNDFIIRFCWRNIGSIDPVIPYKDDYDYRQLIIDLKNYKFDAQTLIEQVKINEFFTIKMETFDKNYNEIDFNKNIDIVYENNKLIYSYNNINYEVSCSKQIYDKLNKFYNGQYKNNKHILFFCILYRYKLMGADNQQLTANINFKKDMQRIMNVNCELFGSSINRLYDNYCSLYYDIEQYFGSLGNFFDISLTQGLYFANPPFDEELMEKMASHIVSLLDKTLSPLGFIITIPIWDYKTTTKISQICKTKAYDMGPYRCYEILKQSKYFYHEYKFCKKGFPYYNFLTNTVIEASNTYLLIIKNNLMEFNNDVFKELLIKNNLSTIT